MRTTNGSICGLGVLLCAFGCTPQPVGGGSGGGSTSDPGTHTSDPTPPGFSNPGPNPGQPKEWAGGETGSIGGCQCGSDEQCRAMLEDRFEQIVEPMRYARMGGTRCVAAADRDGFSFVHSTACFCSYRWVFYDEDDAGVESESAYDVMLGARPACDVEGKGGNCLYRSEEYPGCDPDDATSCDAPCQDVDKRLRADAAKRLDVEVRHSDCSQPSCNCENVFRIDDRCYGGEWLEHPAYDCALSDEKILAKAFPSSSEPKPNANGELDGGK